MWLTIDSIPLETVVLVGSPPQIVHGIMNKGSVCPCSAYRWPVRTEENITYSDVSSWDGCGGYEDVYPTPTHWQPLPEPPQ